MVAVYTSKYPIFYVTVDMVVLTIREGSLQALAIKRGGPPYEGRWALPGGFVKPDEDLATAAARELQEETGVTGESGAVEQLASYGAPRRDPRHRVVSVAHLAILPDADEPTAGSDASHAQWRPVQRLLRARLAFDHRTILRDGVERARSKLEYSTLATAFLGEEFTMAQLRGVYEVIWGTELDPGNFHRKVLGAEGFVVPTGNHQRGGPGRPAALFAPGPATWLHPPLTRRSVDDAPTSPTSPTT